MNFIYRNWAFHNLIAHPLHEIMYWVMRLLMFGHRTSREWSDALHDGTVPSKPCEATVKHMCPYCHNRNLSEERAVELLTQMKRDDWSR